MRREAIIIVLLISVFLALGCTSNDSTKQSVENNATYKAPPEPTYENSNESTSVPINATPENMTEKILETSNNTIPRETVPISITIDSPSENEQVSPRSIVEGTSTGIHGSNLNLYVLVYPEGDYWWVQDVTIDSSGNWESNAYFGDPTKPDESIGKKFRIAVIATSEKLDVGDKFDTVPENVYRADIKGVVRK